MLGVLLAAFLAGAPFAAHAAGSWTYAASTREAQAQQASLHQVPATLLQAALPLSLSGSGSEANARWKAPDGHVCTGQVFVPADAPARSTVTVWVNQAGQLTDPPLQHSQVTGRMYLSEALAVAALAVALITVGRGGPLGAGPASAGRVGRGVAIGRTSVEPPPVTGRSAGTIRGEGPAGREFRLWLSEPRQRRVNIRRTAPLEEEVRPMQLGHRTTRCSPDRTENAVFTGLMGAFLAGSPFVAYAAGRWADAALSRQARLQRNALFQVPATLLGEAPLRTGSGARAAGPPWPSGGRRTVSSAPDRFRAQRGGRGQHGHGVGQQGRRPG